MTPDQSIQPLNVAAATLVVQIVLVMLLALTIAIYRSERTPPAATIWGDKPVLPSEYVRSFPTLVVAIASIVALLLTPELSEIWVPLFPGVPRVTIDATTAITIVFILDLLLVGHLVSITGGSRSSPFLALLFTVPALAIFLRHTPAMFFSYAVVAGALYLILLARVFVREQPGQAASAFMNLACLLVSMFTGYVTRPIPIDELRQRPSLPVTNDFSRPPSDSIASGQVSR